MKTFVKALLCLAFTGLLFTNCNSKPKFRASIRSIDRISVEGVKAFASLSNNGTRADGDIPSDGNTYLYAIDENNNLNLPQLSCNIVFDEEMTEEQRQELIKNINLQISTKAMYDCGPYILMDLWIQYIAEQGPGGHFLGVGFGLYSAIRKSDGKVLNSATDNVAFSHFMRVWDEGMLLTNQIILDNGASFLSNNFGDSWHFWENSVELKGYSFHSDYNSQNSKPFYVIDLSEDRDPYSIAYMGYSEVGYEEDIKSSIKFDFNDSNIWSIRQIGGNPYAFSYSDNTFRAYSWSSYLGVQIKLEQQISSTAFTPEAIEAGFSNNDYLWIGEQSLIVYNCSNHTINTQPLSPETVDFITSSSTLFLDGYAYCIDNNIHNDHFELVKINLFNEQREVSRYDLPQGLQVTGYRFVGSAISNYMRVKVLTTTSPHFISIYGEENLPDLSNYVVHEIVPLKNTGNQQPLQ